MKSLTVTALVAASACLLLSACAHQASPTRPNNLSVAPVVTSSARVATSAPTTKPTTAPAISMKPGLAAYRVSANWEKAIATFEQVATTRPAKVGGTVFIGSSSFTKWKTLEKDMAQFDAVNRGFGGSKSDDVLYYAKRILAPLKPTRIVYYCGSNDLAAKRPASTVTENFKLFVKLVRTFDPDVKIYFIAENAGPKRVPFTKAFDETNEMVKAYCAKTPNLTFIDARDGLFNDDGSPKAELFLKDGVHLNDAGYQIWMKHIKAALLAPTTGAVSTR